MKFLFKYILSVIVLSWSSVALAQHAKDWQIDFQEAASPVMQQFVALHNELLIVIFSISAFVLILLTYVCWRFRAAKNKNPSSATHNTLLEIIWTVFPVLILLLIAIPSLRTLYFSDEVPEADMTLKVVGYQWYWGYEYPDHGNISFLSNLVDEADLKAGQERLLSVDNPVILPVDTTIRIQLTSADVIHSWAMPAFGVKKDAIPGRLNETWIKIDRPGIYYGQCSELCGIRHGFMPIEIHAVSKEEYAAWVKGQTSSEPEAAATINSSDVPAAEQNITTETPSIEEAPISEQTTPVPETN